MEFEDGYERLRCRKSRKVKIARLFGVSVGGEGESPAGSSRKRRRSKRSKTPLRGIAGSSGQMST